MFSVNKYLIFIVLGILAIPVWAEEIDFSSDSLLSDTYSGLDEASVSAKLQETAISNKAHERNVTLALSNNVCVVKTVPERFVNSVVSSIRRAIVASGRFELVELKHTVEDELDNEIKRVVKHGITGKNAAKLGRVRGAKYLLVLSLDDYVVKENKLLMKQRGKEHIRELKAVLGIELIDTSTRTVVFSDTVSSRVLFEILKTQKQTLPEVVIQDQSTSTKLNISIKSHNNDIDGNIVVEKNFNAENANNPVAADYSTSQTSESIIELADKLAQKVVEKLEYDLFEIQVIKIISGESFRINAGRNMGLRPGDILEKADNSDLANDCRAVVIKVERVENNSAVCRIEVKENMPYVTVGEVLMRKESRPLTPFRNSIDGIKVD